MEEKKLTRIPLVAASEEGRAQSLNLPIARWGEMWIIQFRLKCCIGMINLLENNTREGDSPVIHLNAAEVNGVVGVELFESIVLIRW